MQIRAAAEVADSHPDGKLHFLISFGSGVLHLITYANRRQLRGVGLSDIPGATNGRWPALLVYTSLTVLTPMTYAMGADSTTDVDKLKAICVPALEKLESGYRYMRGSGERTLRNNVAGNRQRIEHFEFIFDGKRRRLVETAVKDTFGGSLSTLGITTAFVAAPELCFRLRRTIATEGYSTAWMSSGTMEAAYQDVLETIDAHNYQLNRPYSLPTDLKLSVLIQHPTFQAKSITLTSTGPLTHVRVEFEARTSTDKRDSLYPWRKTAIPKGWFTLCPEQSWAMEEFEYHHRDGMDVIERGTLRYFEGNEGIPRLKRADETLSGNGHTLTQYVVELSECTLGTSPNDVFAPAAFGLTNPAIYPSNAWSRLLWLPVIGALSLAGAVLCHYYLRRRFLA